MGLFAREMEEAPRTAEVSHKCESLHAHVRLDTGPGIRPGDEVLVRGAPVMPPFGEVVSEECSATIWRASRLERSWGQLTGDLDSMKLCEFSFSEEARV